MIRLMSEKGESPVHEEGIDDGQGGASVGASVGSSAGALSVTLARRVLVVSFVSA